MCSRTLMPLLLSWESVARAWDYAGTMRALRAAIVGYGLAGSVFHAPLIEATEGLVVRTVVTSDPGRRERVVKQYPEARVVATADELWPSATEHDFVVIA